MKDSTAKVEENRAAARDGGVLALAFTLFVVGCSETAPAEPARSGSALERVATPTDWIEPGGRFGADFQRFGWEERADSRPESLVEMIPAERWTTDAYCAVWESQRLPTTMPQAQVNASMDRHTRESAISGNIQSSDLSFWHDAVDGISTIEMRFHDEGRRMYQRWRIFRISTSSGVSQINFVCGARMPATAEQESELDAIVDSMRFFPEHP